MGPKHEYEIVEALVEYNPVVQQPVIFFYSKSLIIYGSSKEYPLRALLPCYLVFLITVYIYICRRVSIYKVYFPHSEPVLI